MGGLILIDSPPVDVMAHPNSMAWIEVVNNPGTSQFQTDSYDKVKKDVPFALQYLNYDVDRTHIRKEYKYSAALLENNINLVPLASQASHLGYQVSWHP